MKEEKTVTVVKCILEILTAVMILSAGSANGELFNCQEYGFSVDYADDLKPDVSDSQGTISFKGSENTVITILSAKASQKLDNIEDLASAIEDAYREKARDVDVQSSNVLIVGGKNALEKVMLITFETDKGDSVKKIREIYIDAGKNLILISCNAYDYYFDRADKIYFTPFIDSFEINAVDSEQEACISSYPKYTSKEIWSSPLVADINGDGNNEVIVGTNEGKLYAWDNKGKQLTGFPFEADDKIRSSPALGDIDGDGKKEIVFGSDDGKIYALNADGYVLPGFPKKTEGSIRSSPALGDLNGDGLADAVVGSLDTGLYAIRRNGSAICGFPVITGSSSITGVWSSPALGDLNDDGKLDIVIGTTNIDSELSSLLGTVVSSGKIFAVDGNGEPLDGFPAGLGFGATVGYSSPILADIDSDGSLEIVIGSSIGLHILNNNGKTLRGFPIKTDGSLQDSFMAVGDLDGDKKLEIVAGCMDGRLYVWKSDGSDYPGFPMQTGGFIKHVTLGDIDNDGMQEILGGSFDNRVHAWKLDGSEVSGFPKVTLDDIQTAPTLADIDGDGSLDLVVGSDDGGLYAWEISGSYGDLQWPMARQNPEHTGVYTG